jgi:transcriptional regulator with XRE-family HTH domain
LVELSPGEIIGRNVRAAREAKLFSRPDLAKRSGLSLAGIDHLERGLSARPRRLTIEKLAKALDVDVDILMEGSQYPLGQAPASQDRLFDGVREREAFVEHVRQYANSRITHYEKRLAKTEAYEATRELFNDAYDEWMALSDFVNGELAERWMLNPAIPEDVKEDLGRRAGEVMNRPMGDLVGRIGDRVKELAETQAEKDEAEQEKERRLEKMRERTRRIERERRTA